MMQCHFGASTPSTDPAAYLNAFANKFFARRRNSPMLSKRCADPITESKDGLIAVRIDGGDAGFHQLEPATVTSKRITVDKPF